MTVGVFLIFISMTLRFDIPIGGKQVIGTHISWLPKAFIKTISIACM